MPHLSPVESKTPPFDSRPWLVSQTVDGRYAVWVAGEDAFPVCVVGHEGWGLKAAERLARLFSAAPDLLDACDLMRGVLADCIKELATIHDDIPLGGYKATMAHLDAVLAKARG